MSKRPRSILEYPIVVRQVLDNLVISLPDLGIWTEIPAPPKVMKNGTSQTDLNNEYMLQLIKAMKSSWIKGHRHIVEKKWVPDASTFKASVQKSQRDLTVPEFRKALEPFMDVSLNTIRREIQRGAIKAKQTRGGHSRIPRSELEFYMMRLKENPAHNPGYQKRGGAKPKKSYKTIRHLNHTRPPETDQ